MKAVFALAATMAATLLCAPASAQAADAPIAVDTRRDATFAAALRSALLADDYAAALALIEARPDLAHDPAAVRLRAQLLASLGRTDEALAMLETRLSVDPKDALARFQLGEVHFNARRDPAAELAYRLAVAGGLDTARRDIIAGRLSAIRDRRDWVISAGLSLAPDSNINGGANSATIEIFGLPFVLDDEARQRSGVALSANVSVQRRIRLSDTRRLIGGLNLAILEASGSPFDSQHLSAAIGLEMTRSPRTMVSLAPEADWIRVGGAAFQTLTGARISIEHRPRADIAWDGFVKAARVNDHRNALRDGASVSLHAGRTRYLTPSSLRRASLYGERRDVDSAEESYAYLRVAQGWLLPLPRSLSLYAEPYAAARRHDAPSSLFGVTREDHEFGASVRLAKRDWVFRGAFPFISATISRTQSNIPLYTSSRERFEFGLTRQF